jgi:hypothetical protein
MVFIHMDIPVATAEQTKEEKARQRMLNREAVNALCIPVATAEQTKEEKARQRMLNREAVNALWRLKKALKEDGFYSGRVRLNVWRAAAIDAGKFGHRRRQIRSG